MPRDQVNPLQTPQQIAQAVPKPVKLLTIETEMSELRRRREQIFHDIRAVVAAREAPGNSDRQVNQRIRELEAERGEHQQRIVRLRNQRAELLPPYNRNLRRALAPIASAAADRLEAALAEAAAASAVLCDCAAAIQAAGGEVDPSLPYSINTTMAPSSIAAARRLG